MKKTLIALIATTALPASAQTVQTFTLPAGCYAYLTVQTESCSVDHIFSCEGDAEGTQLRDEIGPNGLSGIFQIDEETQWLKSIDIFSEETERLSPEITDRASITDLIENGIDTYDFTTESEEVGQSRYVGFDSLTGKQVTIDDILLDETEYNITAYDNDGEVTWTAQGNEYISQRFRMFLSGTSTVTFGDDTIEIQDAPVEFIFEGEPGFLSANPKYGCGVTESAAPSALQRLGALHDEL